MYKKLHIALIIKNFVTTGGAERYAVETAQRLLEKGHEIDLYARSIDDSLTKGMRVFRIPNKARFSNVLSLYSFSKQVSGQVVQRSYDVIHTHDKGCKGDLSTVHTFSFKRGKDKMSLLKRINEFGISPRAWLYMHMEKIQMDSQRLAAVSQVIKEDIETSHNRQEGIRIITPGVDIDKFSPKKRQTLRDKVRREKDIGPDETVVLFVGSEFRRKGLDVLIPALEKDMRLFVVGRKEKMDHYQRLVKQYDLSDKVVFTGLSDNVLKYYALADILVLPSVSEAFGMTVLEGMACGLPVITSQQAGCSCIIESGKDGFVFDHPRQLKDQLKALEKKAIRITMGTRARKTAEHYTWDETALQYENLYYDIVRSGL